MGNLPPWTFVPCLKWLGGCSHFSSRTVFTYNYVDKNNNNLCDSSNGKFSNMKSVLI